MTMTRPALVLLVLLGLCLPSAAAASRGQEATFQDDNQILYTDAATRDATLDKLAALGVDRVRLTVLWKAIAPDAKSRMMPEGFDGADPDAYAPGAWANLDAAVTGAMARGMAVNLNVSGPVPQWATQPPPQPNVTSTYEPDPAAFGKFVSAVGTRYGGTFTPEGATTSLPRVDYWSVWNEPNHSSWLTPTWLPDGAGGSYARAASLYRSLLDAAYAALGATGHGDDTILIGETAPSGNDKRGIRQFMKPLIFDRALYCVDDDLQPLTGDAAARLDCPTDPAQMVAAHPALFRASGFSHHPYSGLSAPTVPIKDPDVVTLSDLTKLERVLDGAQRAFGQSRKLPLYLTEFGYQTRPDLSGLPFRLQAKFINESEWLTFKDPRVKTLGQFLLRDDGPPINLTFQTGLETAGGMPKPALGAYKLPLWVSGDGPAKRVWGLLRPAKPGAAATAELQLRAGGGDWRTVRTLTATGPRNVVRARVRISTPTQFRIAYEGAFSRVMGVGPKRAADPAARR